MGGDIRMRGYYEGRYTDLDMMVAQVELRQRIWRRIGAVVWAGAGNVSPLFGVQVVADPAELRSRTALGSSRSG